MDHVEPERGGRQLEGTPIPAVLPWSQADEFAARAMQALLGLATAGTEADFEMVARIAYDMADAMMAQREKRP
jgi:hypothetical protein